jgi:short-subunit dehydrogenase
MKTALITGATSGIGAAFAKAFASQGYDLVLTGRRKEKITAFANELKEQYKIRVEVVIAELSNNDEIDKLAAKIKNIKNLAVLVNNAGFGKRGYFYKERLDVYEKMLDVHAMAVMKLTHAALPIMIKNKSGSIINVSTIATFMPLRNHAVYGASKAFVSLFSESIALELKGTGVKLQALCPGLTKTDFHTSMGLDGEVEYKKRWWQMPMTPEKVVQKSLKCLRRNKVLCVPGFINKVIKFMCALLYLCK